METRERIFRHIRKRKSVTGAELVELLGISRQAVNKHLRALISDGKVAKDGITRGAVYRPASRSRAPSRTERQRRKAYDLKGLEEDKVLAESDRALRLQDSMNKSVWEILSYAFTEMLNNAIDHSESRKCEVIMGVDPYTVHFNVRDHGIGIFHSIMTKFQLPDENAALGELIKGKTTTMEDRHSGEGVFFTSKCADRMSIRSHKIELVFDNQAKDLFVHEKRFMKGTHVRFEISSRSRKRIQRIFEAYAPEEFGYRFEKTSVFVKLFQEVYLSRSEARRLLVSLDRFRKIRLDFKGVRSMGQAFADEVFRVFLNTHPDVEMEAENLSRPLRTMVSHVVDNKSKKRLTIG